MDRFTPDTQTILYACVVLLFIQLLDIVFPPAPAPLPPAPLPPAPRRQRRRRKIRRVWTREWLCRRELHGQYEHLLQELNMEDRPGHRNFIRFEPELFLEMVDRLTPLLKKRDTRMRKSLSVGLKLAVTLRHLATGNDYTALQYSFRVSNSAIAKFVPKVCDAIVTVYMEEVLKCPRTPEEWLTVAQGFSQRWQYHNCLGAVDGKHVAMKRPRGGGSYYFNYKRYHSIVLMAVADAEYRFLYVDVGAEGGAGDGGTWYRCSLANALEGGRACLPPDAPLPNDDEPIPYHFVADDAFAMKSWLLKPFSHQSQDRVERIFSYRLSRARRVVENAFGLLQMRWRIFGTTLQQDVRVVRKIVMCGIVLHNLALKHYPIHRNDVDHEGQDYEMEDGRWRTESLNLMERLMARRGNYSRRAKAVRDYIARYYSSNVGAVPWQERLVFFRRRN